MDAVLNDVSLTGSRCRSHVLPPSSLTPPRTRVGGTLRPEEGPFDREGSPHEVRVDRSLCVSGVHDPLISTYRSWSAV